MLVHEMRAKRALAYDALKKLGDDILAAETAVREAQAKKADATALKAKVAELLAGFEAGKAAIAETDAEIKRALDLLEIEAKTAQPSPGQDVEGHRLHAEAVDDPYTNDAHAAARGAGSSKGLRLVGMAKALYAGGSVFNAKAAAASLYGERHPVSVAVAKALSAGVGASGGFIVPPEYVNEIIELLRPRAVVRAAGPRSMPMPRGTMTLPAQTSAATANYGSEVGAIVASQPSLGDIVAMYHKLTALVPVTNDLMRYADPAADAFVRDDLVKVTALREDLAFLLSDGIQDSPRGWLSFANMWAVANGGSAGKFTVAAATTQSTALGWASTGDSVAASGGNFISSTEGSSATVQTTMNELMGLKNKLDVANVPDIKRRWFFHPRVYNYLYGLLNSLGLPVFRDEMMTGKLLGYPFSQSTQIPTNVVDATAANSTCTFVFLVEMDDTLLLDSMTLELAISREGTYYDANNNLVSAFQKDQTLIRGIMEHDFQMRHQASIAVDQFVTWSPAIQ